ncbi:MAG TPA: tetratricopeptide repeat protein [Terriglobia bacterium]|nr:tetratricopeptide repeat protein [Terriglobia bacterium]
MRRDFRKIAIAIVIYTMLGGSLRAAKAPAPATPEQAPEQASKPPSTANSTVPDHAKSYYHFMLARRYKELAGAYNRPDYIDRAVSEYKLAIEADPDSLFLRTELAELYSLSGHTEEGIAEAEAVLKKDPDYPDAHRLLSRIYYHKLDTTQGENGVPKENLAKAIEHLEALFRVDPSDTDSVLLLGHLYRVDNQPKKAEEVFRKVLQTDPNSKVGLANLAEIYIQQSDFDQAIEALSKIPESEMDSQLFGMLGYSYSQTQQNDKAIAIYEKALAQEPDNTNLRRYYAEALLTAGKNGAARGELQKILKTEPDDGLSYKRLAMLDREEGRFDDARQELEKAKSLSPDDLEIPYQQALLEATVGNDDKAVEILKGLVNQSERPGGQYTVPEANNRALFLERLGSVYRDQQNYPQAMDTFKQILALGPLQGPRAELLIIETLRLEHQPDKAMAEAEAAVKTYPKNQDLAIMHATMLGEAGHVDEAATLLQALLTHRSIDRSIYISIAQVYLQAKRFDSAEQAIQKALDLSPNPEDQEYALFVQGSIFERQKKYDQAEQTFKKVLSVDPLNSSASNYLGYMLADRGVRLDESIKYIQKALELEPDNAAYLDSLGWAYFKMGRYDLAENPLEKAASKIQNDPTIHEHLGNLYLRQGKTVRAQEEWQRALKEWPDAVSSDFDADQAKQVQKQLDELKSHSGHGKSSD